VYDTVIAGGGPAGLSAALMLGRCRRRVIVCDTGSPRNARAREMHGFLTRDGVAPLEMLRLARDELRRYGVEILAAEVTSVEIVADAFEVALSTGARLEARTVLIAAGVGDELPPIPGLDECFGTSVHHCPYCDGWEVRDRALAAIGHGKAGAGLALALRTWSGRVMLHLNGGPPPRRDTRERLRQHGIEVSASRIQSVAHVDGRVTHIVLETGERHACEAIFLSTTQRPRCDLPRQLGCRMTRHGVVKTDHLGQTGVPGLYVAGDASRDVQFVVVAAAEGAKAAVAINKALQAREGLVAA
jgi:thioredoxin reductase